MLASTCMMLINNAPIAGLANCHIAGVYSLVFRERIDDCNGMIRVFLVDPLQPSPLATIVRDDDYAVMPHNHQQDLTLTALAGDPQNITPIFDDRLINTTRYRFQSALAGGEFGLVRDGGAGISGHQSRALGKGLRLPARALHTIVAAPGDAWVVEEGAKARNVVSACYSLLPDKKLDRTGLYVPMNHEDMLRLWTPVRQNILAELGK